VQKSIATPENHLTDSSLAAKASIVHSSTAIIAARGNGMPGSNRYNRASAAMKAGSASSTCLFISHRHADLDVATAVGRYLTDIVGVDIYLSESDEHLQEALRKGDHEKIVQYIEVGIASSTHLLGILSNRTKGSWWVPFEFGAGRQQKKAIAQLLLEEVIEAPSYLKIARILRDSDDLSKWAKELDPRGIKAAPPVPELPRVAKFRGAYPQWS
jgi:hypothetical protein